MKSIAREPRSPSPCADIAHLTPPTCIFVCSIENLRRSVDNINRVLRGTKRLDLFESARVDDKIAIEDIMKNMKQLVSEGLFDHIGLSEVSAETVKRASAVRTLYS